MPSPHNYTLSLHDALPIFPITLEYISVYIQFLDRLRNDVFSEVRQRVLQQPENYIAAEHVNPHRCQEQLLVSFNPQVPIPGRVDRKSTRLNSSHLGISYAVPSQLHSFPTRRSSDLPNNPGIHKRIHSIP